MFDVEFPEDEDESVADTPVFKKPKLFYSDDPRSLHSSLKYTSIKAPPLVEYKSVNDYCDTDIKKFLFPSPNSSSSGISHVQSISSPIVLKSPTVKDKKVVSSKYSKPYAFYSVEELSLVQSLKYWENTKVCPVGVVRLNHDNRGFYLHSHQEQGCWQILLDTSLMKELPKLDKLIQVFGFLKVDQERPCVKVNFCRNLDNVDLPLLVESYKLMQKYVPSFEKLSEAITKTADSPDHTMAEAYQLNDTLDDFNFNNISQV